MKNYPACKELTDVGVFFDSVSYNNVYSVCCDHRVNYQMSHDVMSRSITPCIKIDKPLEVYIFSIIM